MERFWAKVTKTENGCWEWQASRTRLGYGQVKWQGRMLKAHRVAFMLARGRWPDDKCLHSCDNRACVNPEHLRDGSQADNVADMIAKGRDAERAGENNGNARLTAADALTIRSLYPGVDQPTLAARYGVCQAHISRILLRKAWANV